MDGVKPNIIMPLPKTKVTKSTNSIDVNTIFLFKILIDEESAEFQGSYL